jgi:hypothetical protein|tara:strand:- start:479 stop:703 length:225 start_codon:yes stop_codon:yes gene_type:complete
MRELYKHNDKLYLIKRRIPLHNFIKRGEEVIGPDGIKYVQAWRDRLMCDHVLRDQNQFMFCMNVDDVEEEGSNG